MISPLSTQTRRPLASSQRLVRELQTLTPDPCLHNVMLFYGVARREARWFWLAFVYKSAIDAVAGFAVVKGLTTTPVQIWTIEAIAAVWGIVGLLITLWIFRQYQPPLEEIMQE